MGRAVIQLSLTVVYKTGTLVIAQTENRMKLVYLTQH